MVVDLPDKQALLAEPDAVGRLAAERALLTKETGMLRGLTSAPAPEQRPAVSRSWALFASVPADREALEALPGGGRKTANVVMNVAFGESTMAVDTHIFRIGNRTGLAPGATPRAVEDQLVARIPATMLRPAHHWLILHGRYVCKARRPECWRCAAWAWCGYPHKQSQGAAADPA